MLFSPRHRASVFRVRISSNAMRSNSLVGANLKHYCAGRRAKVCVSAYPCFGEAVAVTGVLAPGAACAAIVERIERASPLFNVATTFEGGAVQVGSAVSAVERY